MMVSHQVEGQQRCAFAKSKRLQRVKTAARGAPLPKGSFLAWLRTHSPGHKRMVGHFFQSRQSPTRRMVTQLSILTGENGFYLVHDQVHPRSECLVRRRCSEIHTRFLNQFVRIARAPRLEEVEVAGKRSRFVRRNALRKKCARGD